MKPICSAVLAVAVLAGCSSGVEKPTRQSGAHRQTLGAPAVSSAAGRSLVGTLRALGADLEHAPAGAIARNAQFCGYVFHVEVTESDRDVVARKCFVASAESGRAASFVDYATSDEGDPVVSVYRLAPNGLRIYVDATRDAFGSGRWELQECSGVTTTFPNAPEPLPDGYFTGDDCRERRL